MFGNMCELVFTAAHSALLALCLNNEEINGDLQLFQRWPGPAFILYQAAKKMTFQRPSQSLKLIIQVRVMSIFRTIHHMV